MEDIKSEILKLNHGESYIVPESDYGKAEILFYNDTYFLFEIPIYGGKPGFHKSYQKNQIDEIVKTIESWT